MGDELDDELESDDPSINGLFCFIDGSRECGAACMAYLSEPVSESPSLSIQQKNCMLLVSIERLGRSMSGMTSLVHKMQKTTANEAADRARTNLPKPPSPLGGTPK